MNRVDVVTGVAHPQAIPLACIEMKGRLSHHLNEGIGDAVDRPTVEPVDRGIIFGKGYVDHFVGSLRARFCVAEASIIPMKWVGSYPLWLPRMSAVFHHDSHSVAAVIVTHIAHYPYARMIHLDHGRNPFCGANPQTGHANWLGQRVSIHGYHQEGVARQRQAADLARTSIQDVKKNTLALFYPDRIAMAEHTSIDGERVIPDLISLGHALGKRRFHGTLACIFQILHRC